LPALSIKQRQAMAIAEHHPEKLRKQNRGLLKMSHKQLHEFAATPEKGLPESKTLPAHRKPTFDFRGRKKNKNGTVTYT